MLGWRLRKFTTLVLAEHNGAKVTAGALCAVTAAAKIPGGVHVLVAGHQAQAAAAHASTLAGVSKVLHYDSPSFAHPTADQVANLVVAVQRAGNYSHVVAAASPWTKDAIPRAAGVMGVQPLSEVTQVLSAEKFQRPVYAGNAIATVNSTAAVKVMTVRATAFEKAAVGGSAPVEAVTAEVPPPLATWVSDEVVKSDKPELTSARIVVTGGRAVKSKDNWPLIESLADALGAATGATRAAVDAQFCPNDLQVGQTGKVVAPDLYIALGVSGAIQHIAGMKDSKVIVAINTDPECSMVQIADYSLIADIFKVVPELAAKAKKAA